MNSPEILGELKCVETIEMKVDLDSKLLLSAYLDRVEISATEAVQLLSMHVATVIHPVLHTYSNWGIDTIHPDPYVRRMSIVTVIYNYLGSTWFPRYVSFIGLTMVFYFSGNFDEQLRESCLFTSYIFSCGIPIYFFSYFFPLNLLFWLGIEIELYLTICMTISN